VRPAASRFLYLKEGIHEFRTVSEEKISGGVDPP
jgi:hypothetical protein